jgi:sarcosine oxidase
LDGWYDASGVTIFEGDGAMQTWKTDVAVIGLGAMGAAALYQLALRGIDAIGVDRYDPPHEFGSTHGETRITRQAVGEGDSFAPFVIRSHKIWRELERATGETLMVSCGGLIIGPEDSRPSHHKKPEFFRRTREVAERFDIAHTVLTRDELHARFPQFTNLGQHDVAYYEPGAGYVHPERCVKAQLDEARRLGARVFVDTEVTAIARMRGGVRISTKTGEIIADRAIVAAGAWTAKLLRGPFDRLLKVTRQVLYWFETDQPALYAPDVCPIFIRMFGPGEEDSFYGFPTPSGSRGVKVATEQYAVTTDPDDVERTVTDDETLRFHDSRIARHLAHISTRSVRRKTCLYTESPDANFIIDRLPGNDRVHVISACSGHGFKHSAAIGEAVVEQIVSDRIKAWDPLAPFSLDCFR